MSCCMVSPFSRAKSLYSWWKSGVAWTVMWDHLRRFAVRPAPPFSAADSGSQTIFAVTFAMRAEFGNSRIQRTVHGCGRPACTVVASSSCPNKDGARTMHAALRRWCLAGCGLWGRRGIGDRLFLGSLEHGDALLVLAELLGKRERAVTLLVSPALGPHPSIPLHPKLGLRARRSGFPSHGARRSKDGAGTGYAPSAPFSCAVPAPLAVA